MGLVSVRLKGIMSNSVLLFTPGGWVGACNLAVEGGSE